MTRAMAGALALVILGAASVSAGPVINLGVTTDKPTYLVGETVSWTIRAWASTGDNAGIAILAVTLTDDLGNPLAAALTNQFMDLPQPAFKQLVGSHFGVATGFNLASPGTPAGGQLADINVYQLPATRTLNVGNDGAQHVFAQGSFEASIPGDHVLSLTITGANYWPDATANAQALGSGTNTPGEFTVLPEPASLSLLGLGIAAMLCRRRKSR